MASPPPPHIHPQQNINQKTFSILNFKIFAPKNLSFTLPNNAQKWCIAISTFKYETS